MRRTQSMFLTLYLYLLIYEAFDESILTGSPENKATGNVFSPQHQPRDQH